jgi:hypothetical protein
MCAFHDFAAHCSLCTELAVLYDAGACHGGERRRKWSAALAGSRSCSPTSSVSTSGQPGVWVVGTPGPAEGDGDLDTAGAVREWLPAPSRLPGPSRCGYQACHPGPGPATPVLVQPGQKVAQMAVFARPGSAGTGAEPGWIGLRGQPGSARRRCPSRLSAASADSALARPARRPVPPVI